MTWRGVEGWDDAAWRERGQVFSVLTKLGTACELVRSPDEIKRRFAGEMQALWVYCGVSRGSGHPAEPPAVLQLAGDDAGVGADRPEGVGAGRAARPHPQCTQAAAAAPGLLVLRGTQQPGPVEREGAWLQAGSHVEPYTFVLVSKSGISPDPKPSP